MPRKKDSRLEVRSNVFLSASIATSLSSVPVRIRNLSPRGALLDGRSLPAVGEPVRLVRGELSSDGNVAWRVGDQVGINFSEEIDVAKWVRRIGHPGQQRVDKVVAALTRGEAPRQSDDATKLPSLASISAELDQICASLADTPELTIEVAEDLLKLDALAQTLRLIAGRG